MVAATSETNFLYRVEAGSSTYHFSGVAMDQTVDGQVYDYVQVQHTTPTYDEDPESAEVDLSFTDSNALAELFYFSPPPYRIKVIIYEYDRVTGIAAPYYRGWVVRASFDLFQGVVAFHLKSVWHFFERQSMSDSLSALSRFSIADPRSGVNLDTFRQAVTITSLNDERDQLVITGAAQPDGWFAPGVIRAPDLDLRTILSDVTVLGVRTLTLNAAFSQFSLAAGFTADLFPIDDLTYAQWSVKFDSETNSGANFGGWPYTPNVDPAVRGVI